MKIVKKKIKETPTSPWVPFRVTILPWSPPAYSLGIEGLIWVQTVCEADGNKDISSRQRFELMSIL